MTKRAAILTGLILVLVLAALACPIDVYCSIHKGARCYFTGKIQVIDGILVGIYHCPWNHEVIARCN